MKTLPDIRFEDFKIESGAMMAIDPCYLDLTLGRTVPAANGLWHAKARMTDTGTLGHRVSELVVWHCVTDEPDETTNWETASEDVGVDSGQCGLWDLTFYINVSTLAHDRFYNAVCKQTNGEKQGGAISDNGAVTTAGYGDGGYRFEVLFKSERAIAARLTFIEHTTPAAAIDEALDIARLYAGTDGGHHKAWVIDKMVRALTGDEYDNWVKEYQTGDDGPDTYEWDTGIAP